MCLPVAHGLLGASITAAFVPDLPNGRRWRVFLLGAILANTPDLDYVFLEGVFRLYGWHRGLTHSIGFALILGTLASLAFQRRRKRAALGISLAIASHGLLDLFTGGDRVEILWPWSTLRYTFGNLEYYDLAVIASEPVGLAMADLSRVCLLEFCVFFPVFLFVLLSRRLLRKWSPSLEPR